MICLTYIWICDPHDDSELAARVPRSTAPPLASMYHIIRPLPSDGGLYISGITRGYLWLSHAET